MKFHTLALAAAMAFAPAAAFAASSVELKYDDLDLSTKQGMDVLNKRIDQAAHTACSAGIATTGTMLPSRAERQCFEQTRQKLHERVAAAGDQKQRG
jgi:UrcA family protein